MSVYKALTSLGVALALASVNLIAEAKEVRVFRFSFQIPDAWYVDGGDGEMKLYASGSNEMYKPPLILAETCVTSKEKDCTKESANPFPYDRLEQKEAYEENYKTLGCVGANVINIQRENGVTERRLVCKTVGYSLFITKTAVLWVAYSPLRKNDGIAEFLDAIGRSLKIR